MKRKNFSQVFEGKNSVGTPEVTLRRLTPDDRKRYSDWKAGFDVIGVFHGPEMLAAIQFDDLFDENGNRFYND